MLWYSFLGVLGLVALGVGGELLVQGATRLARSMGLSALVIGVTVVAFGTSAPELAVSLEAALDGKAAVAVGNVVGSNLLNTLVVLGLASLLIPLVVSQRLVWWDVPIMIGAGLLVWMLGADGRLVATDGLILLGVLVAYLVAAFLFSRRESRAVQEEYEREFDDEESEGPSLVLSSLSLVAGLALLVFGADWFVASAAAIATALGVSELVISLTIVAVGTSLPELVTALVAARHGESDIAVGNVVGSNIMNLLLILGVSSLFAPGGLEVAAEIIDFDLPFCIAASIACLPIFWVGHRIERIEGSIFLLAYAIYLAGLILAAMGSDYAVLARDSLYFVVAPLTLGVIAYSLWVGRGSGPRPA